jgi:hypothetical protein
MLLPPDLPDEYIPKKLRPEPPKPKLPRVVTYAIGYEVGTESVAFIHALGAYLGDMLETVPKENENHDPIVLLRFNSDWTNEVLYRWTGHSWKRACNG